MRGLRLAPYTARYRVPHVLLVEVAMADFDPCKVFVGQLRASISTYVLRCVLTSRGIPQPDSISWLNKTGKYSAAFMVYSNSLVAQTAMAGLNGIHDIRVCDGLLRVTIQRTHTHGWLSLNLF